MSDNKPNINKHEVDIENLFKQNANDLLAIKELYRRIEDIKKKIKQINYIDDSLAYKLKKEYESLKDQILDENVQIEFKNKVLEITNNINELISQMETRASKEETKSIQQQVNNLVLGAVGDGNNAEVIQARGNHTVLNERFEVNETDINDIKDVLYEVSKNILNPDTLIKNKWFKDWGTITKNDYTYDNKDRVITPLISVTEGEIYGATDNKKFMYITFNADGSLNKVMVNGSVSVIKIPKGVVEIAFGFTNISNVPQGIMKINSEEELPIYEPYGKKLLVTSKNDLQELDNKILNYSSKEKSRNILDKSSLIENRHIQTWGTPNISNYLYTNQGYYSTSPFDTHEGEIFKSCMKSGKSPNNIGFITFNSKGEKVRISDVLVKSVIIQSGENKIAFALGTTPTDSIIKLQNDDVIPIYEEPGNIDKYIKSPNTNLRPCDYTGDEITMLGKGVIIGDSYVQGGYDYKIDNNTTGYFSDSILNFPANLSRMTGLEILNKGDGGQTATTWWERHQNDNLSGNKFGCIALGINDTYKQTDGWNDSSDEHIIKIVNKLKTENGNNIKIFISTIPNEWCFNDDFIETNERIRKIAKELNLYLVDLALYNNFSNQLDILGGHPTSYGYYHIAKHWKAYVSYIIASNNSDFTHLQFVGTNYAY